MNARIRSSEGPAFDCHVARPRAQRRVPAIVLASAIHGVDDDLRAIADEFASNGYLAVAPDLFWRAVPGPLARNDARAAARAEPRRERIAAGERDLADVRHALRSEPQFNGRAAVIGFCYGGPYAILGPKRLGFDAGIACHGSRMLDFLPELAGIEGRVAVLWGDADPLAPPDVREAYRRAATHAPNVEVHEFPGVLHGYMMRINEQAFDATAYRFSMDLALAILEGLLLP